MKRLAHIWLIVLLLIAASIACTGGSGGAGSSATAAARATEQYGADQFHIQLTAQAQETK